MYDKLHEEYMYLHEKEMKLDRKQAELRGEQRGIKIGEEQGIKIGKEQGVKIGEQRGIDVEKIATAKRMLEMNLDLDIISKATDLDIKIIESLRH